MSDERFEHRSNLSRVLFGPGRVTEIAEAAIELGLNRALILATPSSLPLARRVGDLLGERTAAVSGEARMHTPTAVTDLHERRVAVEAADGLVAVGGGSAIGLAKAIALRVNLPILAIPTTYSGSEMTSVWGSTAGGVKTTGRDPRVVPAVVIYDPELTRALPHDVAGLSGLNSIAHAVEAVYSPEQSPLLRLSAAEAIRRMHAGLTAIHAKPDDLAGYSLAMHGAWLGGVCLGGATMSLHHKLCHVLGGTFDTPHAATHAIVLPYVLGYNSSSLTSIQRSTIMDALGTDDPCLVLRELGSTFRAPASLRELGLQPADLEVVLEQVTDAPYPNPRRVEANGLRDLLEDAFVGKPRGWTPNK